MLRPVTGCNYNPSDSLGTMEKIDLCIMHGLRNALPQNTDDSRSSYQLKLQRSKLIHKLHSNLNNAVPAAQAVQDHSNLRHSSKKHHYKPTLVRSTPSIWYWPLTDSPHTAV